MLHSDQVSELWRAVEDSVVLESSAFASVAFLPGLSSRSVWGRAGCALLQVGSYGQGGPRDTGQTEGHRARCHLGAPQVFWSETKTDARDGGGTHPWQKTPITPSQPRPRHAPTPPQLENEPGL